VDKVGDTRGGKASVVTTGAPRAAGTQSALIENVGDFAIDVIIEKFVD
jgi:hypothetical protein